MLREIRSSQLPTYQKKKFEITNTYFKDGKKIEVFTKNYKSFGSKTGLFFDSLIKTLFIFPLLIKAKRQELFDQWRAIKSGEISVQVITGSNKESPKTKLFNSKLGNKEKKVIKNQTTSSILERKKLLSMGQPRKGKEGSKPVSSKSGPELLSVGIYVTNIRKSLTSDFASCFHTTESRKEINDLIQNILKKNKPTKITDTASKLDYAESIYYFFLNNQAHLHEALPGNHGEKSAKIYWSSDVENELFPHFFFNENCNIYDLVFATIPGSEVHEPLQSKEVNFSKQLQFIGIGKSKIFKELTAEISELSKKVLGENVLEELKNRNISSETNLLMKQAENFTFLYKALEKLKNSASELEKLPIEERKKAFLASI